MIVDKIWNLTNAVRVGLAPRSSHAQRQTTFPDNVFLFPPCHGVSLWKFDYFLFFLKFVFKTQERCSCNGQACWKIEYGSLRVAPATSASPQRFFSRVGLVKTNSRRRLLDTTMIDLMWPWLTWQHLKSSWKRSTKRTHTHTHTHTHTTHSLTHPYIYTFLCLTHQYIRSTGPHTLP
jgi:hypothetical protein